MKHVWILNHYAQEPGGVGGTRHFSLARHLTEFGWKASIIAASTDHATGKQRLTEEEVCKFAAYEGVEFLWLKTRSYSGNGYDRIGNMFDYARVALKGESLADLCVPDAIVGSSVHPLAAWAGCRLAKRYRVPFIFEVRDLWPQTLVDMGRLSKHHPAAVVLRWLEKSLYRHAARIVVLLPKAHEYIVPLGVSPQKIVWIPNGVDVENFPFFPPRAGSDFTLMYFGAFGPANGLETLLLAMQLIDANPAGAHITLRMVGDGPLKAGLEASARKMGLTNIRFESPVAKNLVPALAAQADGFVVCVRDLPGLYRFGVSMNKIFDYMAAARPIVIGIDAVNNPIADAGAGLTVPPENPKALADAILRLAALPAAVRARMGTAGRSHLEDNYSVRRLSEQMASTLNDCLMSR